MRYLFTSLLIASSCVFSAAWSTSFSTDQRDLW
jgi:hypothetical protein